MALLLVFLLLILVLGVGLILPFWAIIDCAMSDSRAGEMRAAWIIGICFFWSLGAIVYGCTSASSDNLRKASTLSAVFALAFVVFAATSTGARHTVTQGINSGYLRSNY